jgi:hypothetical protein
MVQHVRIIPKPLNPDTPEALPFKIVVWRDDQTIKWGLSGGYTWPAGVAQPIIFLPADPARGYKDWPGSVPAPIGPPPAPGEPDRRYYVASSDKIIPTNEPPEIYHYAFAVCPLDNPNCMLDIIPGLSAPMSQQWQDSGGMWHDPEVENQNQP